MSHSLTLPDTRRRDPVFGWLGLILAAFVLLPSWSLDYGLLESTSDEILAAYGWSGLNLSLLWLILSMDCCSARVTHSGWKPVAVISLMPPGRCSARCL